MVEDTFFVYVEEPARRCVRPSGWRLIPAPRWPSTCRALPEPEPVPVVQDTVAPGLTSWPALKAWFVLR
jgi:hypothetical protein